MVAIAGERGHFRFPDRASFRAGINRLKAVVPHRSQVKESTPQESEIALMFAVDPTTFSLRTGGRFEEADATVATTYNYGLGSVRLLWDAPFSAECKVDLPMLELDGIPPLILHDTGVVIEGNSAAIVIPSSVNDQVIDGFLFSGGKFKQIHLQETKLAPNSSLRKAWELASQEQRRKELISQASILSHLYVG